MKKNKILIIYIVIGWVVGALVGLFLATRPFFIANLTRRSYPKIIKQASEVISCPRDSDKIIAGYIASGYGEKAINALFNNIKKNTNFDVEPTGSCEYLSAIDSISMLIRLGQRLKIPQEQIKSLISPYVGDFNNPRSVQEFVATLEYHLSFGHLENVGDLLSKFKRHLHTKYSDWSIVKKQYGYLFYYPYLMGRFLLLKGDYEKSIQYFNLALEFRPDYNGIISGDLVEAYLKMHRNSDARALIQSVLSSPKDTSGFMFFKGLYNGQYQ